MKLALAPFALVLTLLVAGCSAVDTTPTLTPAPQSSTASAFVPADKLVIEDDTIDRMHKEVKDQEGRFVEFEYWIPASVAEVGS